MTAQRKQMALELELANREMQLIRKQRLSQMLRVEQELLENELKAQGLTILPEED